MNLEIMKRDKAGRQHVDKKDQKAFVAKFQKSSMTMKRFCEVEGINAHSFKNWYYGSRTEKKNIQFAEVICESGKKDRGIEIILENRIRVQMSVEDSIELMHLIRELKTC